MPYIVKENRELIYPAIRDEIGTLKTAASVDLAHYYKKLFSNLVRDIYSLITSNIVVEGPSRLAQVIVKTGKKEAVYGNLHYAIAVIVQEVPELLDYEQCYNLDALTMGALKKAEKLIDSRLADDTEATMLLGVVSDAIMEYKRRVNVPYEQTKIDANGDVYGEEEIEYPEPPMSTEQVDSVQRGMEQAEKGELTELKTEQESTESVDSIDKEEEEV